MLAVRVSVEYVEGHIDVVDEFIDIDHSSGTILINRKLIVLTDEHSTIDRI
jgi:hypothetical protein